jgi:hypothetical protein
LCLFAGRVLFIAFPLRYDVGFAVAMMRIMAGTPRIF